MKKIAIILLIISVLSLYVFSVSIFADQTIMDFNPKYNPNFIYSSALSWDSDTMEAIYLAGSDGMKNDYLFTKKLDGFVQSFVDNNIRYTIETVTHSSNMPSGTPLQSFAFHLKTSELFPDTYFDYFDKIEFYFLLNVYCASTVTFNHKVVTSSIGSIVPSQNGGGYVSPDGSLIVGRPSRDLNVSLVAEGQGASNKSKCLVYKVSFSSLLYSEYFDDFSLSNIGIFFEDRFIQNTDIKDIDIGFFPGVLAASFKTDHVPWDPFPDLWDGIVDVPEIHRPPSGTSTYGNIFDFMKKIDFVKEFLVPFGTLGVSFFILRLALWKVV